MSFRTDYKGIHERAYQKLRASGKHAWSDSEDTQYRIDRFASLLSQGFTNGRVLVLGSGDGEVAIGLAKRGFQVLGVDISPTAVEWAKEKSATLSRGAQFVEANVLDLNKLQETFAAAIDDHCFHCIIGPDRRVFLDEVFKCLKPGGTLIIRTQCGDPPATESSDFMRMWDPASRCQVHDGLAGRYFGLPDEISSEVQSAGFEAIQSEVCPSTGGWQLLELLARKP